MLIVTNIQLALLTALTSVNWINLTDLTNPVCFIKELINWRFLDKNNFTHMKSQWKLVL